MPMRLFWDLKSHAQLHHPAALTGACHVLQRTYSTTAINVDFALITLAADVSPGLGYFGIQRGTGTSTLNIGSAGYPADKPSGVTTPLS